MLNLSPRLSAEAFGEGGCGERSSGPATRRGIQDVKELFGVVVRPYAQLRIRTGRPSIPEIGVLNREASGILGAPLSRSTTAEKTQAALPWRDLRPGATIPHWL